MRTLGSLDLRVAGGTAFGEVLGQPKRLALLAYLTVARVHGFHRRDILLALFWPELDEEHARSALSQALRYLRRALGDDVIVNRGSEEVGINRDRLWCDAVAFDAALESERWEEGLTLYRGPLLNGVHLSGCATFEHWMDRERERHRAGAARAPWSG